MLRPECYDLDRVIGPMSKPAYTGLKPTAVPQTVAPPIVAGKDLKPQSVPPKGL